MPINIGLELPVNETLPELLQTLRERNSVILKAPPGAGKSTLVPLALMGEGARAGQILLTQPRRLAARTLAARLSHLNQTEIGRAIGYQVRMDKKWGRYTRVIAMTIGILLRRLLHDPYLDGVSIVVLDEFHERALEMDLALGMLLRLQQTVRPDLQILVMSATIDCGPVSQFLGDVPVLESQGRVFDVQVRYSRLPSRDPIEAQIAQVFPQALSATSGHLLVFLPGVGEIMKTARAIERDAQRADCDVCPLFGEMAASDQDRVLASSDRRKIILATNVAETSLTIDGVTGVIDAGQVRVMRQDPAVGLSRLVLESNSLASADQRAGRAGRQAPGVAFRLWTEGMNRGREAFDTPEVLRGDLTGALLQLAGMGESDFLSFPWLTPPRTDAIVNATSTLLALGALQDQGGRRQITQRGRLLLQQPVHPRLAQLMISSQMLGVTQRGVLAAAMLSERDPFRLPHVSRTKGQGRPQEYRTARSQSDVVDKVTRLERVLAGTHDPDVHMGAVQQVVRVANDLLRNLPNDLESIADTDPGERTEPQQTDTPDLSDEVRDTLLRRAIWEAYPDRLARRRQLHGDRAVMVGGTGVKLGAKSNVVDAELFVCVDVEQRDRDAEVRMASAVDFDWLPRERCMISDECFFHPTQKNVQARRRTYWMDLVVAETPTAIKDRSAAAQILFDQAVGQWDQVFPPADSALGSFLSRLACVRQWMPDADWPMITLEQLHEIGKTLCEDCRSIDELRKAPWYDYVTNLMDFDQQRRLEALAPVQWTAPSGNQTSIHYELGKSPRIAIRMQELFGLGETPRIASGRIPLLLELLGPNYRPQQVTDDLVSFWKNTYPAVRRELLRRYPKHHWPEDPAKTVATRSGLKRDVKTNPPEPPRK